MWILPVSKILYDQFIFYTGYIICKVFADSQNFNAQVARGFTRGAFELKLFTDEKVGKNQHQVAISILRTAEARTSKSGKKLTLVPVKRAKTNRKQERD